MESVKDDRLPDDRAARREAAAEAEALLDEVFPELDRLAGERSVRAVVAVVPEHVVCADPDKFAEYLESVFAPGDEVEAAVESALRPRDAERGSGRPLHAVVPEALLRRHDLSPEFLLDQVFSAFDEIDGILDSMRADAAGAAGGRSRRATAVVSDRVVADPERLLRAVERAANQAEKLELLFRQAKHTLRRLRRYRLSRRAPGTLVGEMRHADEVRTLQYLVEFLHSIHRAADSFEAIDLPRPHIRDYLEHLYRMEDWDAMADLVQRLEQAVRRFYRSDGAAGGGRIAR